MQIKKIIFEYDVLMTSITSYEADSGKVINGAKIVDICTNGSFGGVKVCKENSAALCTVLHLYLDFKCEFTIENWTHICE